MFPNPFETARLMVRYGTMMAEAQMVIGMRLWGMAGLWNVTGTENTRMVQEKMDAITDISRAMAQGMMTGATPMRLAAAALHPVSRRTAANARRLRKRGLKL